MRSTGAPFLLLALAAPLGLPLGVSSAQADDLSARFAARVRELHAEYGVPGLQAAFIVGEDARFHAAVGLADSASGRPMTPSTRLPAGSTGKSFCAAVVMKRVLAGVMDMDEPVAKWFADEEWFGRVPNGGAMTLRNLMNHASGVPDHLADPGWMAELRGILDAGEARRDHFITPRGSIAHVLGDAAAFASGEGSLYTDTAYLIAGLAVEKATGRDYYAMVAEDFLEPLGLAGIHPQNTRRIPDLACGYMKPDNPFGLPTATLLPDGTLNHNPSLEFTGGGFATTTDDLARWFWLLYGGRLFDEPYLDDLLLQGHPLDPDVFGEGEYGLAVFVQDSPWGRVLWHSGWYPGYHTMVRYWPAHDALVAVQINRDYDSGRKEIADELAKVVLPPPPAGR